jgi:hypothetical protein
MPDRGPNNETPAAGLDTGALLDAHWPGPKAMFCKLASDIALAFLADYPTPQSAARLGQARLAAFCRRHAYRGGKPPAELLARLRAAPVPSTGLAPAVLAQLVTAQVQLLRSLQATIGELEAATKRRVAEHPRAELLRALPGVGTINLAQLLAEVGPILDRASTAEQAAAECGAAPVTRASGKTSGAYSAGPPTPGPAPPSPPSPQRSHAVTLGWPAVCRRSRPRQTQPARHPHRRPRLAAGHLGLLAHRHALQPPRPPRRTAPRGRLT